MATQSHPNQRRSTRLRFRCLVKISGIDPKGHAFIEETETITINKNGASLRTGHDFALGQTLTVRTLERGHMGEFQIVWKGQPDTPEAGQIGIEWFDARRFWGIDFPPEDWSGH